MPPYEVNYIDGEIGERVTRQLVPSPGVLVQVAAPSRER